MSGLSVRIDSDAVLCDIAATSKQSVLAIFAEKAAAAYNLDPAELVVRLDRREKLGSTGFGNSVAIPHAKISGLEQCVGLFARLGDPIDYEAHDGGLVDLVFCLLSPEQGGAEHLKALAEISRFLRDDNMIAKLRGAANADSLYVLLTGQSAQQAA